MTTPHDRYSFDQLMQDAGTSPFYKYQLMVLGERNLAALIRYELITGLCGPLPGLAGMGLRYLLYPRLFRRVGKNVVFGRNLTLRGARRITLGNAVAVDDNAVLSVRGGPMDRMDIGDGVLIGRGSEIKTRAGSLLIGDHSNISSGCRLSSTSRVVIGRHCLLAPNCSVGGVRHGIEKTDRPVILQPIESRGGVHLGDGVWLGAHVVVNDGVTIGADAVVGAGAVVTDDLPAMAVAVGVPAKVVRFRGRQGRS